MRISKERAFCPSQSSHLSTTGQFYSFKKVPQKAEARLLSSIGFDFAFCTNPFLVYMAVLQIFEKSYISS